VTPPGRRGRSCADREFVGGAGGASGTAIEPSPTAPATRLVEPCRTSLPDAGEEVARAKCSASDRWPTTVTVGRTGLTRPPGASSADDTPLWSAQHKQGIKAAKAHELVDELVVLGGDQDVLDAYAHPVEEKRGLSHPGARPRRRPSTLQRTPLTAAIQRKPTVALTP
jgi:hypothetical protein